MENENDNSLEKYLCPRKRGDGFGGQYQSIIFTILYAAFNNYKYVHRNIEEIEHNYNNDDNYLDKINNCINLGGEYLNCKDVENCTEVDHSIIYQNVENNIDDYTNNNITFNKIKECFWKNKDRNVYKNDKFNIAIHIRRPNRHDTRVEGSDTPDNYYLYIMNYIRQKYNDKELLFHIYSQGDINQFDCYKNEDVIFHIDEDIVTSFVGLVGSDVLITSQSSFSYVAAILSDGEIYYLPFWHKPKKNWIVTG
jgi:hypothetical protein